MEAGTELRRALREAGPVSVQGELRAGDVLVLLEPALDGGLVEGVDAQLAELVAVLARRNFVRAQVVLSGESLGPVLAGMCRAAGVGFDVNLEDEVAVGAEPWLCARSHAALVTCSAHAHLALTLVAERGGRFCAQAVGRVTDSGLRLRVHGELVEAV